MPDTDRDVVTIGRVSVDLYGQQIGGRLEDMGSFAKSVGGSPANIAIGAARLGLGAGLISRVGDEAMGRFIREQLQREGVDVRCLRTDRDRLTALVLLGVRDDKSFPLIFYRENCADNALDETDIEEEFIASSRAVVVTGTHFARANTDAAQRKAMRMAHIHSRKVVLDIDYRPSLWGLAGHGAGDERYIASGRVSQHLQSILPECDLIVGTEQELCIAGGTDDTLAALRLVRKLSSGTVVLKRGPMGCVIYPGAIPKLLDDGITGPGFPVEIYNVLGAGDAFLAGFLSGWLRDAPLEICAKRANACGAFAVSRLLCSPEYPTSEELEHFLRHGSRTRVLRADAGLNHIHWATTRRRSPERLAVLDMTQIGRALANATGTVAMDARIEAFERLVLEAALSVAKDREGFGVILDGDRSRSALFEAEGTPLWIARPLDPPDGGATDDEDAGSSLIEWPVTQTVGCRIASASAEARADESRVLRIADAARRHGRGLMIEIENPPGIGALPDTLSRLYQLGIRPDWWLIADRQGADAWRRIGEIIASHDPWCHGVLTRADGRIHTSAQDQDPGKTVVAGGVLGAEVYAASAARWHAGALPDREAVTQMAAAFERFAEPWIAPWRAPGERTRR